MSFAEVAAGSMKLVQKPEPPFYAFCVHCRQQFMDPDMKWIDLAASYDGGVEQVGGIMVTVDDVHLCEGCATNVGKLIGMNFTADMEKRIKKLDSENRSLRGKLAWIENQSKDRNANPDS